jgi:hypothetical protein
MEMAIVFGVIPLGLLLAFLIGVFDGNIRLAVGVVLGMLVLGVALNQAGFGSSSNPYSDEYLH